MLKKSTRQALFFLLVFLIFFLTVKTKHYFALAQKERGETIHPALLLFITGLLYTLIIMGIYHLAKLGNSTSEGFWDVTPAAQCRGGPYMWQGDSEHARMCRDLASTKEGRCDISSYSCPIGYNGVPQQPFYYSQLSDDNWKNERCTDKPTCGCP